MKQKKPPIPEKMELLSVEEPHYNSRNSTIELRLFFIRIIRYNLVTDSHFRNLCIVR